MIGGNFTKFYLHAFLWWEKGKGGGGGGGGGSGGGRGSGGGLVDLYNGFEASCVTSVKWACVSD